MVFFFGCGRIHFRLAMGRVQRRHVALLDRVEAGLVKETREAAPLLRQALLDPAITESRLYSCKSFRKLHGEALEKVAALAEPAPAEDLPLLVGELSAGCRSCHERFR